MDIQKLYEIFKQNPLISTDTRHIEPGSIFFALKGANFNGNAFAEQALDLGASHVVIDEKEYKKDTPRHILVSDVLKALQNLATYHRNQLQIPIVGITGTNGKTTTKELLYAVLSQKYRAYATKGNLNNHIGVPLSLLSIDSTVEVAVIEMGANHVGEIATLCEIAQPNYGLITNVGKAHLEGFGSFEGVKTAKGELYSYLSESDGIAFLQANNDHLLEMIGKRSFREIVKYGFSEGLFVSGEILNATPYISLAWQQQHEQTRHEVSTKLTGSYNLENVLSAIAVGLWLGVAPDRINEGLSHYTPTNNRSQITKTKTNTVIADFYNANASSMAAALENMKIIEGKRKALILGDMFELGNETADEHQKIIIKTKEISADQVIFVGKAFYAQREEGGNRLFFESTEDVKRHLAKQPLQGCTILLKGSRGMAFENLMGVL